MVLAESALTGVRCLHVQIFYAVLCLGHSHDTLMTGSGYSRVGICSAKVAKIELAVDSITHIRTTLFPQPSEVLQEISPYPAAVGICLVGEESNRAGGRTRTHFLNMRW
jgi:hypothetical protein